MNDYYFKAEQMTVGYDGIPLIKDIDIAIGRGKILTLIGPNGAGKSTILKSIIGQLRLLGGNVMADDLDLMGLTEKQRAKMLSVVMTGHLSLEYITCREVVGLGRIPYTGRIGILTETDRDKVNEAMALVHVSELADRQYSSLSDGQRQRVLLARAIAQEPDILVLDEPTSYLDIRYKLEFLSVLKELKEKKNLTVIMSLHELDMAEIISDRVLCVKGEYIDRFGTPDEIFNAEYMSGFYEVSKEDLQKLGKWRMG